MLIMVLTGSKTYCMLFSCVVGLPLSSSKTNKISLFPLLLNVNVFSPIGEKINVSVGFIGLIIVVVAEPVPTPFNDTDNVTGPVLCPVSINAVPNELGLLMEPVSIIFKILSSVVVIFRLSTEGCAEFSFDEYDSLGITGNRSPSAKSSMVISVISSSASSPSSSLLTMALV